MGYVFLDGSFQKEKEGKVSCQDRALLFGDGVFTTLLLEDGRIPFLHDHLKRLEKHCQKIGIIPPFIEPSNIAELAHKNKAAKGKWRIRITISGGKTSQPDLSPRKHGFLLIKITPLVLHKHKKLRLCLYPSPIEHPLAGIKTLAYLDRFWIRSYALQRGYDDCVVRDAEGNILESSFANLFWIRENELYYPKKSLPYLHGVTLSRITQAAKKCGLKVTGCKAKPQHLRGSSVYLSNSLIGFLPVSQIEKNPFPDFPAIEMKLKKEFRLISQKESFFIS